jgi:hypothetical protein
MVEIKSRSKSVTPNIQLHRSVNGRLRRLAVCGEERPGEELHLPES